MNQITGNDKIRSKIRFRVFSSLRYLQFYITRINLTRYTIPSALGDWRNLSSSRNHSLTAVFDAVVDQLSQRSVGALSVLGISEDESRQKDALLNLGIVQNDFEDADMCAGTGRRRRRHVDDDVELRWTGDQRVVSTQFLTRRTVVYRH